jgi:lysophospholipase L1-like esterase
VKSSQTSARLWAVAGALVLIVSVGFNVAPMFYWHLRDDARAALSVQLAKHEHQSGPTITLGGSIIAATGSRVDQAINLGIDTATIDWIATHQLDIVADLAPSRIIIAAGINDLRAGSTPREIASRLFVLVDALEARILAAKVIALAVLPPARSTAAGGAASVASVFETNRMIVGEAAARGISLIDHSLLFARDEGLEERLTDDGLHPNAAGQAVLSELLVEGLVGQHGEQQI